MSEKEFMYANQENAGFNAEKENQENDPYVSFEQYNESLGRLRDDFEAKKREFAQNFAKKAGIVDNDMKYHIDLSELQLGFTDGRGYIETYFKGPDSIHNKLLCQIQTALEKWVENLELPNNIAVWITDENLSPRGHVGPTAASVSKRFNGSVANLNLNTPHKILTNIAELKAIEDFAPNTNESFECVFDQRPGTRQLITKFCNHRMISKAEIDHLADQVGSKFMEELREKYKIK